MGICWFRGKEIAVVNSKVSIFEQPMFDQKGSVVGIFPVSRAIVSFVQAFKSRRAPSHVCELIALHVIPIRTVWGWLST